MRRNAARMIGAQYIGPVSSRVDRLIDYLHTYKLTRYSMCAEMAWFVVVETHRYAR